MGFCIFLNYIEHRQFLHCSWSMKFSKFDRFEKGEIGTYLWSFILGLFKCETQQTESIDSVC